MSLMFALLFVAQAAPAADATPAAPAASAEPKKERKICRAVDTTGTRFPKKDCHTKAEWDDISRQNQTATDRMKP